MELCLSESSPNVPPPQETVPEYQPLRHTPYVIENPKQLCSLLSGKTQLGNIIDHGEKLAPLLGYRESYRLGFSG